MSQSAGQYQPPSITILDHAWQECEDDPTCSSRLLTTIVINGQSMHLEAYEIETRTDDLIHLADEDVDKAYGLIQSDACPETIELRGKRYVLIATPYGE
jgi:hypothetical protein